MVSEPVRPATWGFATDFIDMSWFYYIVADQVDCVHVGNHG
jgi:hypothetical protein